MFYILVVLFVILFIIYNKRVYSYWKKRNLESYPINAWILGNFSLRTTYVLQAQKFYHYFRERNLIHGGIYHLTRPAYIAIGPELIRRISSKDFDSFNEKGLFINNEKDPLCSNVFTLGGPKWHQLRTKISPAFTTNKFKAMLPGVIKNAKDFADALDSYAANGSDIKIRELTTTYSAGTGSELCFGIEINSFRNPHSEYFNYCREIAKTSNWLLLQRIFMSCVPNLACFLGMKVLPKDAADFFAKLILDTIKIREETGDLPPDLLQSLIDAKNDPDPEKQLNLQEIVNQCFVFFLAIDSMSTVLATVFLELSRNPDIQEKIRAEMRTVFEKHNDTISWESLNEMTYLEQVINESLRMYPTQGTLIRQVTREYQVPNTDVVLDPGTRVYIPIFAIHRDPEYYPNPNVFNPDRFAPEECKKRHPSTFLAFGLGYRQCLGVRLSYFFMKVALISLLSDYKFLPSDKTNYPVTFENSIMVLNISGTVYVKCSKLSESTKIKFN